MRNEYTAPEVIEVGNADEVILGNKELGGIDELGPVHRVADTDLDD